MLSKLDNQGEPANFDAASTASQRTEMCSTYGVLLELKSGVCVQSKAL